MMLTVARVVDGDQRRDGAAQQLGLARTPGPDDQHVRTVLGQIELDGARFADAHGDAQSAAPAARPLHRSSRPVGIEPIGIDQRHQWHHRGQQRLGELLSSVIFEGAEPACRGEGHVVFEHEGHDVGDRSAR